MFGLGWAFGIFCAIAFIFGSNWAENTSCARQNNVYACEKIITWKPLELEK